MVLAVPPRAEPVLRGNKGTIYAVSSFGVEGTTFGPDFQPGEHFDGDRYRELDFRHQFPRCTRHDGKVYDFQGRLIRSGSYATTQPFIGSSMAADYVSLDQRRPSNPYRLARLMVRSFTSLVFGEGRFPALVSDDPDTAEFAEALKKAAEAEVRFVQARNIGGGVGTVGVSWRFWEGLPRLRIHNGKNLIAHSWIDRESYEVEHVTEITQVTRVEWDPEKKQRVRNFYWHRRDWTPTADVGFVDCMPDKEGHLEWVIDEDETFFHDDGFPHFVWIRNGADDDDGSNEDGECDFEGLFESLDSIDVLSSVLSSGTVRNLDPTLILGLDAMTEKKAQNGLKKGSGNALNVGPQGTAKYLELSGTAATTGLELRDRDRAMILESAQCVVPSTAELTAAGTSSVAQKMLFAPMLSATSVHRTQYGMGFVRVFEQMIKSARRRYPEVDEETGAPSYAVVLEHDQPEEEGGEPVEREQPVDFYLDLPPKVVSEPVIDPETQQPTGEQTTTTKELNPGRGKLRVEWPPYFEATAQDLQQKAGAIAQAAGGKPCMSQQTATELIAREVGIDEAKEWERVTAEAQTAAKTEQGMFAGGTGGAVGSRDELPPGATPKKPQGTPKPVRTPKPKIKEAKAPAAGTVEVPKLPTVQ